MAASYVAEVENGDHHDDPTQADLQALISGLDATHNTFFTLGPDSDEPTWYASVSALDAHTYEVEYADALHDEHQRHTTTDPAGIAAELHTWLTARR